MNDPIHNFTLRYHCIGGGHGVNRLDWRNGVYAHRRRFNRVYRDFLRTVQKEKEVLTRPLSRRINSFYYGHKSTLIYGGNIYENVS